MACLKSLVSVLEAFKVHSRYRVLNDGCEDDPFRFRALRCSCMVCQVMNLGPHSFMSVRMEVTSGSPISTIFHCLQAGGLA